MSETLNHLQAMRFTASRLTVMDMLDAECDIERIITEKRDRALNRESKDFTLFPNLPTEIRLMIWQYAMEGEDPRLVNLYVHHEMVDGCRFRPVPPGTYRNWGRWLTIHDRIYTQVPSYFFVCKDSRHCALKHYSIRFSVVQTRYRPRHPVGLGHKETNLVMSPKDILVSWHSPNPDWEMENRFDIAFGPDASLVQYILVQPWTGLLDVRQATFDRNMYGLAAKLISRMGNLPNLKKVLTLFQCEYNSPMRFVGIYGRRDIHPAYPLLFTTILSSSEKALLPELTMEKLAFLGIAPAYIFV